MNLLQQVLSGKLGSKYYQEKARELVESNPVAAQAAAGTSTHSTTQSTASTRSASAVREMTKAQYIASNPPKQSKNTIRVETVNESGPVSQGYGNLSPGMVDMITRQAEELGADVGSALAQADQGIAEEQASAALFEDMHSDTRMDPEVRRAIAITSAQETGSAYPSGSFALELVRAGALDWTKQDLVSSGASESYDPPPSSPEGDGSGSDPDDGDTVQDEFLKWWNEQGASEYEPDLGTDPTITGEPTGLAAQLTPKRLLWGVAIGLATGVWFVAGS